ncbi:hypothetical protein GCM10010466_11410 [Planomonospora alba]|uniref:Uncharacterized protein n=1 Tax=Planomonospora alba TaxID=161354 RepID=A0ABP6MS09_9ACTN
MAAPDVAERAGRGTEVLLTADATCLDERAGIATAGTLTVTPGSSADTGRSRTT